MTVKELEELSGIKRANIRFYEREGLISPMRMDNGYRDYSKEELQILLRIKLLRSLHIPLDEIKELKKGSLDLADTLSKQISKLELEKNDVTYAQDVCRVMQDDRVSFTNLDAEKYLYRINKAVATGSSYFSVKGDELPDVFYPWRRYFARIFDASMYSMIWSAFLALAFHVNLVSRSNPGRLLDSFIAIVLMLFLEPLWLHFLGTTPGKAIFGLRIENDDGSRLSYGEGLERTWGVIGAGLGYNIPIYSLVRLWKSYKLCRDFEPQPWDYDDIIYTIRDKKWYRTVFFIGANVAVIAVLVIIMSAQRLPPNRGDLTVAEFSENFNYYCKYYGERFGNSYLNQNGKWAQKSSNNTLEFEIGKVEKPDYLFTVKNGSVTEVLFTVKSENDGKMIGSYNSQLFMASLAFAGAQKDVGIFSSFTSRISKQIQNNTFKDFSFEEAGIKFNCDFEFSGYMDFASSYLMPKKDAAETSFSLKFSMNNQ